MFRKSFFILLFQFLFLSNLFSQQNSALSIIQKAIKNRKEFYSDIKTLKFEAYSKSVTWMKDNKISRYRDYFFNGFWEHPDNFAQEITAHRAYGNSGVFFPLGVIFDFSEDRIEIGGESVLLPFAEGAEKTYNFKYGSQVMMEDILVNEIIVEPKSQETAAVFGNLWISEIDYNIVRIELEFNEAAMPMFLKKLKLNIKKARFFQKYWLPFEQETYIGFKLLSFLEGSGERIIRYTNYELNPAVEKKMFSGPKLSFKEGFSKKDSLFWKNNTPVRTDTSETAAMTRLKKGTVFPRGITLSTDMTLPQIKKALLKNPRTIYKGAADELFEDAKRKVYVTSFSDLIRFNRVEGLYMGIGLKIPDTSPDNFKWFLKTGYGFSDKKVKYSAGFRKWLWFNPELSVGLEIYDKLEKNGYINYIPEHINSLTSLIRKFDYFDYFSINGFKVDFFVRPVQDLTLNIAFKNHKESSVDVNTNAGIFKDKEFRSNPIVTEGRLKSIELNSIYHLNEFLFLKDFLFGLRYEFTDNGFLNSDFDYSYFQFDILKQFRLFHTDEFSTYLNYSKAAGNLPCHKYIPINGSAPIANYGFLKGSNYREFAGKRIFIGNFEYNFRGRILRKIAVPGLRRKYELIPFFNLTYSEIPESEKAQVFLKTGRYDTDGLYKEYGFGIGHKSGLFRINFIWRKDKIENNSFKIRLNLLTK